MRGAERTPTTMTSLATLRARLVELHKRILESERVDLERFHGRMSGAEFLQVASGDLRLGWLAPLSELIVELDDAAAVEGGPPRDDAEALVERARALVAPPAPDTPFGRRYRALLQRDPSVTMAHAAVVEALARGRA